MAFNHNWKPNSTYSFGRVRDNPNQGWVSRLTLFDQHLKECFSYSIRTYHCAIAIEHCQRKSVLCLLFAFFLFCFHFSIRQLSISLRVSMPRIIESTSTDTLRIQDGLELVALLCTKVCLVAKVEKRTRAESPPWRNWRNHNVKNQITMSAEAPLAYSHCFERLFPQTGFVWEKCVLRSLSLFNCFAWWSSPAWTKSIAIPNSRIGTSFYSFARFLNILLSSSRLSAAIRELLCFLYSLLRLQSLRSQFFLI